jgi:hypothetical protein
MDTSLRQSITKLARGEILRVDSALGQSIAVVKGMVWITQEGDRRDTFLRDGDSFVFDQRGTALAQAITATPLLAFVGEAAEVIEAEPAADADEHRALAARIRLHQDLAAYARLARVPAHQLA